MCSYGLFLHLRRRRHGGLEETAVDAAAKDGPEDGCDEVDEERPHRRGPGRAIPPQPARAAKMRGPKSRAGLKHAWVSGAMTAMSADTVSPMKTGARRAPARPGCAGR